MDSLIFDRSGEHPAVYLVVFGLFVPWFRCTSVRCRGINEDDLSCGIIVSGIGSTSVRNSAAQDILQVQ